MLAGSIRAGRSGDVTLLTVVDRDVAIEVEVRGDVAAEPVDPLFTANGVVNPLAMLAPAHLSRSANSSLFFALRAGTREGAMDTMLFQE